MVMDRSHPAGSTRTLVNPRPEAVRLVLSDGSERIVAPWGLAVLPDASSDGLPLEVIAAFFLQRRTIPGLD
jgi:hypothetical protein